MFFFNSIIEYNIKVNNKKYSSTIKLKDNTVKFQLEQIEFNINWENNLVNISIENQSKEIVSLNKIELKVVSLPLNRYNSYILNPEYPHEKIIKKSLKDIKEDKIYKSFFYTLFEGMEEFQSELIGFLSSHKSRNYIKFYKNKDLISVYLVYDFVNYRIKENESVDLDSVYNINGNKYFLLLKGYAENISVKNNIELNFKEIIENKLESIEISPLYSSEINNNTLTLNNKPVYIKIDNKKQYLIDISKEDSKKLILAQLKKLDHDGILYIRKVKPYIIRIIEEGIFNPYNELSDLLYLLKKDLKYVKFSFDDCPKGIAVGNLCVINDKINFNEKRSFLDKVFNKNIDLHYDFFIKTLLQNRVFFHNTIYNIDDSFAKKAINIVSLNMNLSDKENNDIIQYIDDDNINNSVGAYIKKDKVFSLWRFGKDAVYLAVINLSNFEENFYLDLSVYSDCDTFNGVGKDLFDNKEYLIHNSSMYIKNLNPKKCLLMRISVKNKINHIRNNVTNQVI
jgi:hypothetical protein